MRLRGAIIAIVVAVSGCQKNETEGQNVSLDGHRIAYVSEIAREVALFDLETASYTYGVLSDDPQKRYEATDIGGEQIQCSDENFFCTKGHVDIVVPKDEIDPQGKLHGEYSHAGVTCQFIGSRSGEFRYLIDCRNEHQKTTFLYGKRGVERYQIFCEVCDPSLYFLDTPVGLFQPST
ncbi:MAG: hypothetical protein ABJP48_06965 [Erythrobacter sp.]